MVARRGHRRGRPRRAAPGLGRREADGAVPADEHFMRMAIAGAGDFPFGTVIVRDGARRNGRDPPLRRGAARRRVLGTTHYTSGEPCPMCMSAILSRGIGRLVFVASIDELATRLAQIVPTSQQVAEAAPFAAIAIAGGVLPAEALALFPQ